jgi:multiple sugar transport system permease protein
VTVRAETGRADASFSPPLAKRAAKVIAAYALALLATAFFAFPLVWITLSSMKSEADVSAYPPTLIFTPTASNYEELFGKLNAGGALLNSFFIVCISTLLAMIMGTMAAYALARFSFKGKENIALQLLSIRMMPAIVSVIPLFIIARSLGVFDTPWLLIAIYALNGLPFVVWVMRVFIQDVPKSIEEAAMIDGCGRYEVFFRITLPLVLPGLAAVLVIIFMFSWNEYLFASMLTSSQAKTLPVLAANAIKPKAISWGLSSAAAVVMSLPVIILVLSAQRYLVRGLTLGAVKG